MPVRTVALHPAASSNALKRTPDRTRNRQAAGFNSGSGVFYPQTIDGQSIAFDTDDAAASITLSGTIQRVGTHTLAVGIFTRTASRCGSRLRGRCGKGNFVLQSL
jgi:hypothetical protein